MKLLVTHLTDREKLILVGDKYSCWSEAWP
jgi:hypothetical protein